MNGLLWILLLCCCGKNNGYGCSNSCASVAEKERYSCSLKERDEVWTPYMSNGSERDNDCGCEHNHNH